MAHHKRKRPKNRRAGCLLCKPWKINSYNKRNKPDGEKFSDHKRRRFGALDIEETLRERP